MYDNEKCYGNIFRKTVVFINLIFMLKKSHWLFNSDLKLFGEFICYAHNPSTSHNQLPLQVNKKQSITE